MSKKRVVKDTPATPHFDFIYGRFDLSSWHIPYFSTNMTFDQAAQSLKLATDFPGYEMIEWRLDELYQRDIDWSRVSQKIVPYLRASDQPQFFNALTIALIPISKTGEAVEKFSDDITWNAPKLDADDRFELVKQIGPITCGWWEEWKDFDDGQIATGQLRWNPKQVFAVALDGQHRLAAIQEFARTKGATAEALDSTRVPVILMVLDPQVGYAAPTHSSLVDVLRKLFIDLNKHAITVSRGRQILLDDNDPTSICVRAVVGESIGNGVEELASDPPRLPLSLVDWHTEQAKFDDGPYLTTTLGLDWAIAKILGTGTISDYTDYGKIARQLKNIRKSLELDLVKARERLKNLASMKMKPFHYSDRPENNELDQISTAFQTIWTPAFVHMLTALRPYESLVNARNQSNSFTLDFTNWYYLDYRRKQDRSGSGRATRDCEDLLSRLSTRNNNPVSKNQLEEKLDNIESIKKDCLAFNVAFQRAYFLAFSEFERIAESDLSQLKQDADDDDFLTDDDFELDESDEDIGIEEEDGENGESESEALEPISERARNTYLRSQDFVRALNAAIDAEPRILDVELRFSIERDDNWFWLGTLLKPEGGIDFTQGASQRASLILFWIACMHKYDDIIDPEQESDFEEFWSSVNARETNFSNLVWRSIKRFSSRDVSAAGRILRTSDLEYDEESAKLEAYCRMKWLWETMGL